MAPIMVLVLAIALVTSGPPDRADAHSTYHSSYPCTNAGITIDHWISASRHAGGLIPFGTNWSCTSWRSRVTTTSWSGGGGSGWYTKPTSTSYSLWNPSYWLAQSFNNTYCYLVRTGGQGKTSSTTYSTYYNYKGYQSGCWQD